MKKFTKNTFIFILALLFIDNMLNMILKANRPDDYKQFIESKKEVYETDGIEALILGDCLVSDAINPKILESYTNQKTFNLGVYQSSPNEHYFLLLDYLKHHDQKLETIYFGINSQRLSAFTEPGNFTPLIMNDLILKWRLNLEAEDKDNFSLVLKSVYEKGLFRHIKNKLFNLKEYKPDRVIESEYNGYLEFYNCNENLDREYTHDDLYCYSPTYDFNEKQLFYINEIIRIAEEENIEIIIVETPLPDKWNEVYMTSETYEQYADLKSDLIKNRGLKFYEYPNNDMEYSDFLNYQHLNSKGAIKFTEDLGKWVLKQQLAFCGN